MVCMNEQNLEREYYATHKTKWDGVLFKVDDHKISPGFVEFSGGAKNNTTITKERRDVKKIVQQNNRCYEWILSGNKEKQFLYKILR